MLSKKKNNKGFTLVELLVVIAIIGILAVVAVPALFKNIEKGKIADLEADISAIRSASLSFYADESKYPTAILEAPGVTGSAATDDNALLDELEGLSFPFGGTYGISQPNGSDKLVLTITPDTGKSISKSGAEKLESDLGDKMLSDIPSNGGSLSSVQIELMSK